jgi:signal transduction histidine kinase
MLLRAQNLDLVVRSVTHELRQPLSLISGYAELLASGRLTDRERDNLLLELRAAIHRLAASLDLLERSDALPLIDYAAETQPRVIDLQHHR